MRLVLIYSQSDDCTYSCECVHPIEAESPEAAYCAIADKALEVRKNNKYEFEMFGLAFDPCYLTFLNDGKYEIDSGLKILTIDEWFSGDY